MKAVDLHQKRFPNLVSISRENRTDALFWCFARCGGPSGSIRSDCGGDWEVTPPNAQWTNNGTAFCFHNEVVAVEFKLRFG